MEAFTGTIEEIAGNTITVISAEGDARTFELTDDSQLLLDGGSCSLDQLKAAQTLGVGLDCTVIYDVNNEGEALIIDAGTSDLLEQRLASVEGTITQFETEGTPSVTILTKDGSIKTFNVTPSTELLLAGGSCSLETLLAAEALGVNLNCTVIYDINDEGEALIIDVGEAP